MTTPPDITAVLGLLDVAEVPAKLWIEIPCLLAVLSVMFWMLKKQDKSDRRVQNRIEAQDKAAEVARVALADAQAQALVAQQNASKAIIESQDRTTKAQEKMAGQFEAMLERQQKGFDRLMARQQEQFGQNLESIQAIGVQQINDQRNLMLHQMDSQRRDHRGEVNALLLLIANATASPANKQLAEDIRRRQEEMAAEEARLSARNPIPRV